MERVLIFTTRQLCYSSAEFFADRLADEFENLGYQVEMCQIDTETNDGTGRDNEITPEEEAKMESYMGKSFLAVIDINSRLPRMVLDDGSLYLDHIDAPFYNYILDNPLYHHDSLSQKLKNYNVILVDREQCEFVKMCYPHIKNVIYETLSASKAISSKEWQEKNQEVLFLGTFRDPWYYWGQMRKGPLMNDMLNMADLMLSDVRITVGQALLRVLSDRGEKLSPSELALRLHQVYPVELYVRNYLRREAVEAIVTAGIPIRIAGDWWEKYEHIHNPNVILDKPVFFSRSFNKIVGSAIILDSSPFFQSGIHDRIYAGMINHTAVLTDQNAVKKEELGNCITQYDPTDAKDIVYKAEELLTNTEYRRNCVDNAYELFMQKHTWKHVAATLADYMKKYR